MSPGPKPWPWNTKNKKKLKKAIKGWEEVKPSQYAIMNDLSTAWVRKLCRAGRIKGAHLSGPSRYWAIPKYAKILKPDDPRCHPLYLVTVEGGIKVNSFNKDIKSWKEATKSPI